MIFPDVIDLNRFLWGEITLTHRLVKNNHIFSSYTRGDQLTKEVRVQSSISASLTKLYVGAIHSVQPGRHHPGAWWSRDSNLLLTIPPSTSANENELYRQGYEPLRIRILDIWQQDLRAITLAQMQSEGFYTSRQYWLYWLKQNDKAMLKIDLDDPGFLSMLMERPAKNYNTWALKFEVVRD